MGKLPLNDPCWRPMGAVIDQLGKQFGDLEFATRELQRDLKAGKRHSMRRHRITGESELLSASFWETYAIGYRGPLSVTICRQTDIDRHKIDEYGNLVAERLDDWLFYVWVEDEPDEPKADGWQVARVKELLPIAFPKGLPTKARYKEIQNRFAPLCKSKGWKLPSIDSIARALGRRK